jgi:hypothetical protein
MPMFIDVSNILSVRLDFILDLQCMCQQLCMSYGFSRTGEKYLSRCFSTIGIKPEDVLCILILHPKMEAIAEAIGK